MSKLWRKATFPSVEDLAREVSIKKSLTAELTRTIRAVQIENVGKNGTVGVGEYVNNFCAAVEAIFIHGFRVKFSISAVFSTNNEKIPDPDFWPVVMVYSHKDVLFEITELSEIKTDVGRCRAWLRLSLNDGLIVSCIDSMLSDHSTLKSYYDSYAYLRDPEEADIMKQLLEGLNVLSFKLPYNCNDLNVWNHAPLILAGIWSPPVVPKPVMPATDAIEFFSDQDSKCNKKTAVTKKLHASNKENEGTISEHSIENPEVPDKENTSDSEEMKVCTNEILLETNELTSSEDKKDVDEESSSKMSFDSDSVPDLELTDAKNIDTNCGNKLNFNQSGWSSDFEYQTEPQTSIETTSSDGQSYDSLLQSYNRKSTNVIIGTPEISNFMSSANISRDEQDDDNTSSSLESKSLISDYEVIPTSRSLSDPGSQHLLAVLEKICPEKGLDVQDYQCNACGCQIGIIYGKAYLCHYDGYSYCSECHVNDEYYIPARIIHNWDFQRYPVSKNTKQFLMDIETEPRIDMKNANPLIYTAVEEMAELQVLRTQLTFLHSYIFTCRESLAKELRQRLWPREYLYEHVHLYSISDLIQAHNGILQQTLQKVITFARKHVLHCNLCTQKGFICEICSNPKPIYPFDVDLTHHCDYCLAVYHMKCREAKNFCPKCERKKKRQEMDTSTTWYID